MPRSRHVPLADHRLAEVGRERELPDPVWQPQDRREDVDQKRPDSDREDRGHRERGPGQPGDGHPGPGQGGPVRDSTSVPVAGVTGSCPTEATPRPTAVARKTVTRAIASQAAMPLATAQRARVSGVASWSSSRPDVSSDDRAAMNVAAASPMSTNPKSANANCMNPAVVVMSIPGMRLRKISAMAGDPLSTSSRDPEAAAMRTP